MLHAKAQVVTVEIVARDDETWLQYAALIVLVARVDALMTLEAVIEVGVETCRHAEPVLHTVRHLCAGSPVACLAECHVLYQVVGVHEERTSIY